ncbi:hypothetical protein LIER_34351 [Lithospermum erythrorhizon]|uniref:Uncharacterized protein n=1 Tax=Lithospermum erythrorhizon TaxID=34254 RepID=A0AAV3RZ93_LITER
MKPKQGKPREKKAGVPPPPPDDQKKEKAAATVEKEKEKAAATVEKEKEKAAATVEKEKGAKLHDIKVAVRCLFTIKIVYVLLKFNKLKVLIFSRKKKNKGS